MNVRTSLLTAFVLAAAVAARAQVPDFRTNFIGWDTSTEPQAHWPWAARVGDLDQNGDPDVAAVNWWFYARLSVVLNGGDGTFAQPALYNYSKGALDLELADVTGDGALDVVVSNTGANYEGTTLSLFRNLGNGVFSPHMIYPCGAGPVGLAAADYDGDGRVDVAVARYGGFGSGSQVALLRNDGAGGFLPAVAFAAGASPYKLAAGDLDGDGDPDLAVARDHQQVSVLLNTGGAFAAPMSYPTFGFINTDVYPTIALGDVDDDGDLDLVYSSTGLAIGSQPVTALLRNQGQGTFAAAEAIVGSGAMDLAVADVTGDGWLDLLGARESSDFWTVTPNDGRGGFLPERVYAGGEDPIEVAAADTDGDGDLEAIVVARDSLETAVFDNPGDGDFAPPPATPFANGVYGDANTDLIDAADVDLDGDRDLVAGYNIIATTQGAVALLRNDGAGGFAVTTLPSTKQVMAPKLGDLDGDGLPDLAWADDFPPYDFRTRRNLGGVAFGPEVDHPVGTCGNTGFGLIDVDDDGDLDACLLEGLACVSVPESNKRIFISRNRGDGTFDPPYIVISDTSVNDIEGVDLDGDGHTDLITGQPGSVVVLRGIGGGEFAPKESYAWGGISLAIDDYDGDGEWDVAVGATGGADLLQRVTVRLGNGDGALAAPAQYLVSYSYTYTGLTGLASGDVDGDGDPDLLASNWASDDVSLLRNLGDGAFAPHVRYGAWSHPSDVLLGDFGGDGRLDAAVLVNPQAFSFTFALGLLEGSAHGTQTWVDLGSGLAGSAGTPVLAGTGELTPLSAVGLSLAGALPAAPSTVLVIGLAELNVPFKGGVMVPMPALVLAGLPTDATGSWTLGGTWPAGIPSGTEVFLQAWIPDPAGPAGFAASNGLSATVP
ncbi:MAG TPA: VCBS repeat-containing protein [Planctomycetota bacterium]|nr:VCBS repeat-containing protein [Planctomycetota bacterium]